LSREVRSTKKLFKVFCEGDTEYNYFENIRVNNRKISLSIRPVNMGGGGYTNFINQLKGDANSNCIAKFIVIDGDKALTNVSEKANLKELIDYCRIQNTSRRTPHILIVDFPDFEYVACLHFEEFKGKRVEQFITGSLKYKSISDFKSDKDVYVNIKKKGGTSANLLKTIKKQNSIINNRIIVKKKTYEINIGKTDYHPENIGKKGTNFNDFYDIISGFGVSL
jgi:hypothetical protein